MPVVHFVAKEPEKDRKRVGSDVRAAIAAVETATRRMCVCSSLDDGRIADGFPGRKCGYENRRQQKATEVNILLFLDRCFARRFKSGRPKILRHRFLTVLFLLPFSIPAFPSSLRRRSMLLTLLRPRFLNSFCSAWCFFSHQSLLWHI